MMTAPAPRLQPAPPPPLHGGALTVLRQLHRAGTTWVSAGDVARGESVSLAWARILLRQLTACGWTERQYRTDGPRPTLLYRLTTAGQREATTTFGSGAA